MAKRKATNSASDDGGGGRTKLDDLEVGTWLSSVAYCRVDEIDRAAREVTVTNDRGQRLRIAGGVLESETHSARQFSRTEEKTATELAAILAGVKDRVFTVMFLKQQTDASVAAALQSVRAGDLDTPAKRRKFARDKILRGEERVLTGHLIGVEERLGRVQVWDLETAGPRRIDSRTIRWIIVDDAKYVWNGRADQ